MHSHLLPLTFGAEFEVILPRQFTQVSAAAEFARIMGQTAIATRRNTPAGQWKVIPDGSLSGHGTCLEFVSPVLQGQDGLDNVVQAVNALRTMGATVNRSCGFHVHVGGHDQSVNFFKTLVKLYARYEDPIDSMMPSARRGNAAYYCRSVKMCPSVDAAATVTELGSMLSRASQAGSAKYHKVNVAPYAKPTVEFRHHAGTVDPVAAANWIITCLRLTRAAMDGKTGETGAAVVRQIQFDLSRLSGKQLHCCTLVARPEGATNEEIRAAYGYATISARKQLADAGLTYTVVRDRATGKDRFVANLPTETVGDATDAAFPVTLDGLADLIGAEPDVRAYFQARAGRAA
jgi:hypothetical protein